MLFGASDADRVVAAMGGLGATGTALSQAEAFALLRPLIPRTVRGVMWGENAFTDDELRRVIALVYQRNVMAKSMDAPADKSGIESDVTNAVMSVLGSRAVSFKDSIVAAQNTLNARGYGLFRASEVAGTATPQTRTATGVQWPASMTYWASAVPAMQSGQMYQPTAEIGKPAVQSVFSRRQPLSLPAIDAPKLTVPGSAKMQAQAAVSPSSSNPWAIAAIVTAFAVVGGLVWYNIRKKGR